MYLMINSEAQQAEQDEECAGHERGYGKALHAVLLYYAVDDDDEGARGSAYLHLASAKHRHDKSGHDGGYYALLGSYARRYTEGYGERQGHNAYYYSGHDVCHQCLAVIAFQS